jgi:anaerobic ribonucleoside-triphosphate reductase/predicted transcriptional regulator
MEQLSHDYSYQTETRRDGVLESASKRVRMIFSVMASPNRIDILRILNSKGPLTYSELKSLAGFKSKKESGKFAYHLRKLLRQSLVALNKAERRYTITNLGKLVLSLARQIEERSIIESGKMYVRTTRHSIEEFNSHKIIQSLVREANMPLEQANKITEEVENKIYKFQTSYLTSSLIRETVNSVLIEHGHEEYRNKLARLGLPASDIVEILNNIDTVKNGADSIMSKASQSVFSEHLMLNILPKDIADMHLNGEISISNSGTWSLLPDTVFLNITDFAEVGLDLKGKFLNVSRIPAIKNSDDLGIALPILISLLSREVSTEIVLDGIIPLLLDDQLREPNEIASRFENILIASSVAPSYSPAGLPVTTITVQLDKFDKKSIDAVLSGYKSYITSTPVPRIGICLINNDKLNDYTDTIASIVRTGGIISILQNGSRSNNGVRKNIGGKGSGTVMTLQSLSINLPRLAYQSNKDETYFRARLALMIKPALSAMSIRKKVIADLIRKQMIPVIANSAQFIQLGTTNVIINLTGIEESVYKILGHDTSNDGAEILQKVLKTAVDVAAEHGKQLGEDSIGIAMIHDDSATRFATLDSDKYGRISLLTSNQQKTVTYSQGLTLNARELLSSDNNIHNSVIKECISIDNILNGGLSLTLDVSELYSDDEVKNAIESVADLPFFRLMSRVLVCNTCGKRSSTQSSERCEYCKSPYLLMI